MHIFKKSLTVSDLPSIKCLTFFTFLFEFATQLMEWNPIFVFYTLLHQYSAV